MPVDGDLPAVLGQCVDGVLERTHIRQLGVLASPFPLGQVEPGEVVLRVALDQARSAPAAQRVVGGLLAEPGVGVHRVGLSEDDQQALDLAEFVGDVSQAGDGCVVEEFWCDDEQNKVGTGDGVLGQLVVLGDTGLCARRVDQAYDSVPVVLLDSRGRVVRRDRDGRLPLGQSLDETRLAGGVLPRQHQAGQAPFEHDQTLGQVPRLLRVDLVQNGSQPTFQAPDRHRDLMDEDGGHVSAPGLSWTAMVTSVPLNLRSSRAISCSRGAA